MLAEILHQESENLFSTDDTVSSAWFEPEPGPLEPSLFDIELEALLSQEEHSIINPTSEQKADALQVETTFEAITSTPDMQLFEKQVDAFSRQNQEAIRSFFTSDDMKTAEAYMAQNHNNCGEDHTIGTAIVKHAVASLGTPVSLTVSRVAQLFGSEAGHDHEHWECCGEEVHGSVCPKCNKRKT